MSATYDFAQSFTSPVQTMFAQQERLRNTVMDSSRMHDRLTGSFKGTMGASAALTMGPAAKTGWVPDTSSFARPLPAVSALQGKLAEQRRMHDRLMGSFEGPKMVTGVADMCRTLGPLTKTGLMPGTAGVAKSWQSRGGVASAVQDTLAEQHRTQDRLMKSLGPLATAGPAHMYTTAWSSVLKGSAMSEPFGFAKSLDAHRGLANMLAAQGRVGAMLRSLDSLTAPARAAAAYGTLGSVTRVGAYGPGFGGVGTIAGYGPGFNGVGAIAGFPSSLTDGSGFPRIPSAVTAMARALAGSAQLAGTIKGFGPFTGQALPTGIGEYLRASAVAGEHAMTAGGPAEPTLIVPNAAESASILEWLRLHAPTYGRAAYVCHLLAAFHAIAALARYEAHVDLSPVVEQGELSLAVLFEMLGLLLHGMAKRQD
jgi:hypothetical protein